MLQKMSQNFSEFCHSVTHVVSTFGLFRVPVVIAVSPEADPAAVGPGGH